MPNGWNQKPRESCLESRPKHGRTTATNESSPSPRSVAKSTSTAPTSMPTSAATESTENNCKTPQCQATFMCGLAFMQEEEVEPMLTKQNLLCFEGNHWV